MWHGTLHVLLDFKIFWENLREQGRVWHDPARRCPRDRCPAASEMRRDLGRNSCVHSGRRESSLWSLEDSRKTRCFSKEMKKVNGYPHSRMVCMVWGKNPIFKWMRTGGVPLRKPPNNPFPLLLNVPQILKTSVHLKFWKICGWPIWLLIDFL